MYIHNTKDCELSYIPLYLDCITTVNNTNTSDIIEVVFDSKKLRDNSILISDTDSIKSIVNTFKENNGFFKLFFSKELKHLLIDGHESCFYWDILVEDKHRKDSPHMLENSDLVFENHYTNTVTIYVKKYKTHIINNRPALFVYPDEELNYMSQFLFKEGLHNEYLFIHLNSGEARIVLSSDPSNLKKENISTLPNSGVRPIVHSKYSNEVDTFIFPRTKDSEPVYIDNPFKKKFNYNNFSVKESIEPTTLKIEEYLPELNFNYHVYIFPRYVRNKSDTTKLSRCLTKFDKFRGVSKLNLTDLVSNVDQRFDDFVHKYKSRLIKEFKNYLPTDNASNIYLKKLQKQNTGTRQSKAELTYQINSTFSREDIDNHTEYSDGNKLHKAFYSWLDRPDTGYRYTAIISQYRTDFNIYIPPFDSYLTSQDKYIYSPYFRKIDSSSELSSRTSRVTSKALDKTLYFYTISLRDNALSILKTVEPNLILPDSPKARKELIEFTLHLFRMLNNQIFIAKDTEQYKNLQSPTGSHFYKIREDKLVYLLKIPVMLDTKQPNAPFELPQVTLEDL